MKQIKLGVYRNLSRQRSARKFYKKLVPIFLVLICLMALSIFLASLSGTSTVIDFIFSGTSLRSNEGRVNVLLLGMAGGRHDGATLTDTILVATYNLKTNQLHLISIPRDLWLPSFSAKANALYQIGLSENNGLELAKTGMGNIVGLPIHYGLRVDFGGFIDAINTLGGIDVMVEKTFDDYLYPIEGKENDLCGFSEEERDFSEEDAKKLNIESGKRKVFISPEGEIATDSAEEDKGIKYFSCRYEHIHFEKGLTHMDGEEALTFVRSRHGTQGEGSDFARSRRQENVLQAIRERAISLETLFNPKKLSELINTFGKSINTDISIKDVLEFYKLSKKLNQTYSIALDDSIRKNLSDGRVRLLTRPSPNDFGGAYVLVSEDDDFSIIHKYIMAILRKDEEEYESSASARTSSH